MAPGSAIETAIRLLLKDSIRHPPIMAPAAWGATRWPILGHFFIFGLPPIFLGGPERGVHQCTERTSHRWLFGEPPFPPKSLLIWKSEQRSSCPQWNATDKMRKAREAESEPNQESSMTDSSSMLASSGGKFPAAYESVNRAKGSARSTLRRAKGSARSTSSTALFSPCIICTPFWERS